MDISLDQFLELLNDKEIEDTRKLVELYKILNNSDYSFDDFFELFNQISNEFEEHKLLDTNSISNLALLDQTTNTSYGNAFFPIKRKRIIANDCSGLFVPICTKNLFLKYYSVKVDNMMIWTNNDAVDYLNNMKSILKPFINSDENE